MAIIDNEYVQCPVCLGHGRWQASMGTVPSRATIPSTRCPYCNGIGLVKPIPPNLPYDDGQTPTTAIVT